MGSESELSVNCCKPGVLMDRTGVVGASAGEVEGVG